MAAFDEDYQAPTEEPEGRDFDPLPAGDYIAQIIDSEVADTKTGNGKKLALTWEVTVGEFERRQFWQNINYRNASPKAQEIGRQQLDEVTWSTGVTRLTETEDLHFKPCHVRLKVVPPQNGYAAKNEVVAVKRLEAGAPAPRQTQGRPAAAAPSRQTAPAPTARTGGSDRPWPKRA